MASVVHAGLINAAIASGLAIAVAIVGRFCRRPALVHGLWLLVLLRLIVPPVLAIRVPWPSSVEKRTKIAMAREAEPQSMVAASARGPSARRATAHRDPLPLIETAPSAVHPPNHKAQPAVRPRASYEWETVVGLVWLVGALTWWTIAGFRLCAFRRILRRLAPAASAVQARAQELAGRLGLGRSPVVYFTEARTGPLLWAVFGGPRLLIPAALWGRLTDGQRDTLLVHELAHLRRGDQWVRRLELLVLGLYWWHPVAWWAGRRAQEAEEQCCDAWVVWALPEQAPAYAGALLAAAAFLSLPRPALPIGASGVGQFRQLQRRLTMILRERTPRQLTWPTVAGLLAFAAVLLPLAPLWGQGAPRSEPPRGTSAPSQVHRPGERATTAEHLKLYVGESLQAAASSEEAAVDDAQDAVDLLRAQLDGKKAELQEAQALLQQAVNQLKRADNGSEVDALRTDVRVKQARVNGKEAQIKEYEIRLRQAMRHLALLRRPAQAAPQGAAPAATSDALVVAFNNLSRSDAGSLRALALQLEAAITWDAVTPEWRNRRDGWVKDVDEAKSVPRLAELIKELEVAVLWSAVTPGWSDRREGWIEDCNQAKTVGGLAKLLGELENYVTWEAVAPSWKDARDGWVTMVTQCKAL